MDFCNSNDYSTFRNYQMKIAITYIIGIALFCVGVQCIFICGEGYAHRETAKHLTSYFRAVHRYNDAISAYASASWVLTIDEYSMERFQKQQPIH